MSGDPEASPDDEVCRLAERALRAYDLPAEARLRPLRLFNNAVFEVDSSAGRFVLRIHRTGWRTFAQVRSELTFLRALAESLRGTAVSVPVPIAARDGELVVEETDAAGVRRAGSMTTWVDGQPLRPGSGLGPRGTYLLGEALGRIHLAGAAFRPPPDFDVPRWDADGLFTDASPYRSGGPGVDALRELMPADDYAVFVEVADRTRAAFDDLAAGHYDDPNPAGLVHNDFILGNCHLARGRNGWRVAVLDFDDCGQGWYLFDLGAVLGNLADFRTTYGKLRRAFLAGYRSVRHLPTAYEPLLPLMMAARHASHCLWALGFAHSTNDPAWPDEHLKIRAHLARECLALATS